MNCEISLLSLAVLAIFHVTSYIINPLHLFQLQPNLFEPDSVMLKMGAAHSFKTLVSTYDHTQCQNPEVGHPEEGNSMFL